MIKYMKALFWYGEEWVYFDYPLNVPNEEMYINVAKQIYGFDSVKLKETKENET